MPAPCPVCGETAAGGVLSRAGAPVFLNVVYPDVETALQAPRGDIDLQFCPACALTFNAAYRAADLDFGGDYENEQSLSARFSAHMDEAIDHLVRLAEAHVGELAIVEIGCGQAIFLRRLAERLQRPATLYGFDPVLERAIGATHMREQRVGVNQLVLVAENFTPERAPSDRETIYVMRAVLGYFAHPVQFLRAIRERHEAGPPPKIFIETPALETIIAGRTFFDIYYEYYCYYSKWALQRLLSLAGWGGGKAFPSLDGQYWWIEAGDGGPPIEKTSIPVTAVELGRDEKAFVEQSRILIEGAARTGAVALWGAGGKGVSFANMVDPERTLISCLIDINPMKQGCFAPGTAHPIVSPETAVQMGVSRACLMNPAYSNEIESRIASLGAEMSLIAL